MSELFGQPYDMKDTGWIVKCYMDIMHSDGLFLSAVEYIVRRTGFSTDGAYCRFPDVSSYFYEDHFEGVEFSYGYPPSAVDTVIVSEAVCEQYVRLACDKYLKIHPEHARRVSELLVQFQSQKKLA